MSKLPVASLLAIAGESPVSPPARLSVRLQRSQAVVVVEGSTTGLGIGIHYDYDNDNEDELDLGECFQIMQGRDSRSKEGVEVLKRLFETRRLFAVTGNGYREIQKFKMDLFETIWDHLKWIRTQHNKKMILSSGVLDIMAGCTTMAGTK